MRAQNGFAPSTRAPPKKPNSFFCAVHGKRPKGGEGNRAASAEEEQTRKSEYDGITMTDGWFLLGGLGGKDRTADRKTQLTV